MEEDFDINNFYIFLQENFRKLYEEAQNRRYTICLPCNSSVVGVRFDLTFIEQHILKPSPFFKGEFHTTNIGEPNVLQIDGGTITTGEGFSEHIHVEIIGEETGYNKAYESYKILLIDKPFVPVFTDESKLITESKSTELLKERITEKECKQFLENLPGCKDLMKDFHNDVQLFKDTYYVVRGYLTDAAQKLQSMYKKYIMDFKEFAVYEDKRDTRFIHNVNNSVESYIVGECHSKIYPVICSQCGAEEKAFINKLATMKDLKSSHLGLKQEFVCDLSECIKLLNETEIIVTPLEILNKLKEVLDSITTTVTAHVNNLNSVHKSASEMPCITTDEIIPLLVLVIVQCQPTVLVSNIYYVEHFHWSTSALDNLSFVSFKAALQYIQTTDFEQYKESKTANTVASEPTLEVIVPEEPISSTVKGLQFDRQLDRINKMFQNCTIDNSNQYFPTSIPFNRNRGSQKKAMLGDFLSSLQDDGSSSSYGKQD